MSQAKKCKILDIYIADHECDNALLLDHKYCRKCDDYRAGDVVSASLPTYYKLIEEMLKDAVRISTRGKSWIELRQARWEGVPPPEKKRDRIKFLRDAREVVEIRRDMASVKRWVTSDDDEPGSFVWVCTKLQEIYKAEGGFLPRKLRKRLGYE